MEFDDITRGVQHFYRKLKKYGLTFDSFVALLNKQGNRCAICQLPETALINRSLAIDHDHVTNTVRGLLCMNCNQMLGKAKDNPEILRKAADYLELHASLR